MSSDTRNNLHLELHVPDFKVAEDFYGKLGFKIMWKRQESDGRDYLIMNRNGTVINFWPGNEHVWDQSYFRTFPKDTKRGYGVEIVFFVEDVHTYFDHVKNFANIIKPLELKHWGVYDFRLEDPFGFYLCVSEPRDILIPGKITK